VLESEFPAWRDAEIHESSPAGAASAKLHAEARRYSSSQFFRDAPLGSTIDGVRCENLEQLTFADASIDIFVTQDVLEHVLRPDAAVNEIARVLRRGGAHVFTLPIFGGRATLVRAEPDGAGGVRLLCPADYHGNPIDPNGSLVVREWGDDFVDFVREHSGLDTSCHEMHDRRRGLDGEYLQVFVTRRTR
jgi:SAM-dependent methyltransferase